MHLGLSDAILSDLGGRCLCHQETGLIVLAWERILNSALKGARALDQVADLVVYPLCGAHHDVLDHHHKHLAKAAEEESVGHKVQTWQRNPRREGRKLENKLEPNVHGANRPGGSARGEIPGRL